MKKGLFLAFAMLMVSCANKPARDPSSTVDLTGHYLGEGLFQNRTAGLRRPAMRVYFEPVQNEADSYHAVLIEYDQLLSMALPYGASQKAPFFNKIVGYLNSITTRISAYKVVPGQKRGSYEFHNLSVRNGEIVAAPNVKMMLQLGEDLNRPMIGASLTGDADGQIVFPDPNAKSNGIMDALSVSQFELAAFIYKKGHLASTWRGNWQDLEGSYLSEYGRVDDGVLELMSPGGQKRMKFIKTNNTKAKYFTNPKSATIEGEYIVSEPVPKMYVLTSARGTKSASDVEMTGRIGLFLDVFDGSAPEAGSHLVTELAFTNPNDPEDFMMYYEHAEHKKNVGVAPKK